MGDALPRPTVTRLRPAEVKQIFDCAETSQGLLDAFFQVCAGYFPSCLLVLFVHDDVIVRRIHGPGAASGAIGARIPRDESAALGPVRGGGELGAAAVTVEATDALVVCGAWPAPGEALLLPLVVRGRTAAAVLGESRISDADRKDVLAITTMAASALQSLIVRRSSVAAVSEATRIISAPIREEESAGRRRRIALGLSAGTGVVVLVAMLWWFFGGRSPLMFPVTALPGQPRVDPVAVMSIARTASGLGDRAELIGIRATVAPDAKTNLLAPGLGDDPWPLRLTFAAADTVAEVDVDRAGVYPPSSRERGSGRAECGACGCDVAAPAPHCALAKILEAARGVGLTAEESAVVTYGFCKAEGPRWTVSIPGRGEVRLSDASCAPLARETLYVASRKLDTIPGAPRVKPVELLADARRQASLPDDALLVRIEVWFAAQDGTVDVSAAGRRGRAEYTFAEPSGPSPSRVRRVVLDGEGMSVRSTEVAVTAAKGAPIPSCSVDKLWRSAIGDAPSGSLAHVIYEADPAADGRGLWTIELASSAVHHARQDVVCAAWE